MARRSAVRHGRETAVVEEAGSDHAFGAAVDPWDVPEGKRRRGGGGGGGGGRWGGSGGRWWIWVGRAILWALIIVILVNGVRAPIERFTANESGPGTSGGNGKGQSSSFPSSEVGAFALQFANVYLNYNQQNAGARQTQLRAFIPDDADGKFGWNEVGQFQVQSVQLAGVEERDANNAVVTVLARSGDRQLRLAVPVYTANGAMVVSARPALLPPPAKAALPQAGVLDRDAALEGELQPFLGTFFQAYAHSDQAALARFSDGTAITGLADAVTYVQVREVVAPKGPAGERTVTATVAWQIPGAAAAAGGELEQSYQLVMIKKGTTWYVRDIRGAAPPGAS